MPDYTGPLPSLVLSEQKGGGGGGEDDQFKKQAPLTQRYSDALSTNVAETYPNIPIEFVSKTIGADWARLGRVLGIHPDDIRQIRREVPSGGGQEALHMLKIWVFLKGTSANGKEKKGIKKNYFSLFQNQISAKHSVKLVVMIFVFE